MGVGGLRGPAPLPLSRLPRASLFQGFRSWSECARRRACPLDIDKKLTLIRSARAPILAYSEVAVAVNGAQEKVNPWHA